jgi:hypothetical protein
MILVHIRAFSALNFIFRSCPRASSRYVVSGYLHEEVVRVNCHQGCTVSNAVIAGVQAFGVCIHCK